MDGIHESPAELRRMRREARRDPEVWREGRAFLPSPFVPAVALAVMAVVIGAFLSVTVALSDVPWGQLLFGD